MNTGWGFESLRYRQQFKTIKSQWYYNLRGEKKNAQELLNGASGNYPGEGAEKKKTNLPGYPVLRKNSSAIAKGLMNYMSECQPKP